MFGVIGFQGYRGLELKSFEKAQFRGCPCRNDVNSYEY